MLSTLAVILLAYVKASVLLCEKPNVSLVSAISCGACLEALPFPPHMAIPCSCGFVACFSTPVSTVVTPELCQSYPNTQPNAWNQYGSLKRFRSVSVPYSFTIMVVICVASRVILVVSHVGALP